jgi:hypothetical protein
MEHPIYPKLVGIGAANNMLPAKHESPDLSAFLSIGLLVTENDPKDDHILPFIDAVLHQAALQGLPANTPRVVAEKMGKPHLTWPEYLNALVAIGIDIDELSAQAKTLFDNYLHGVSESKRKAAAFFELFKTKWAVSDEQVRLHIDCISIYDFVELVLVHSDAAKARSGASIRHRETRAMKAEVFAWLNANMKNHKSMDAAAQAITKQQPIVFRTARDWVGEWNKLRSASTP